MSHAYAVIPPSGSQQDWAHHDGRRWLSSQYADDERESALQADLMLGRERDRFRRERVLQGSVHWRRSGSAHDSHRHRYSDVPTPGQRDDRWQHCDRPMPSQRHTYPALPPLPYPARNSRSPNPPWETNGPGFIAASERTGSPRVVSPGSAPRYRSEQGPRFAQGDSVHRTHHSLPSPVPVRRRSSFLPPSLNALAIDRPLLGHTGGNGKPNSHVTEGGIETGDGSHRPVFTPRTSLPSPFSHTAARLQPSPPTGSAQTTSLPSPPRGPLRPSETESTPRLPSLSSLLH